MVNLRDLPTLIPTMEARIRTVAYGCLSASATVWWFTRKLVANGGFWTITNICYLLAGFCIFIIAIRTFFLAPHEGEKNKTAAK